MKTNVFVTVSLIVGIVIGLVLRPILFPPSPLPPPVAGLCANPSDRCIEVLVVTVAGQPQIAPVGTVSLPGQGAIFWTIGTPGYTFPANGIDFANPGGNPSTKPVAPSGEFSCGPMPGNAVFKCIDRHGSMGTFGYKVTLSGSPAVQPLDPWIINN